MKRINSFKNVIIVAILAVMLVGYFFHLSNKTQGKEEDVVKASVVQDVLSRNLKTNYPSSPKEVIKYFSEITQCFYNEEYSETELVSLADKMLGLYDDELVAEKDHATYLLDLKSDIDFYKENGYKISSFAPSASTDVEKFSQDGYEWARIWCLYTIRSGKQIKTIQEVFILRQDEKNHWRIYGWRPVENE